MDRLWAPWRAQYIQESSAKPEPEGGCFLCRGLASSDDRENLLAWRGEDAAVFLNRYPYNNGHLLVAPTVHKGRLDELEGAELTGPIETLRRVVGVLDRMMWPQGYNIGLNMGRAAGAGSPGTSIGTSSRGGTATRTSCRSWATPRSSLRVCSRFMISSNLK